MRRLKIITLSAGVLEAHVTDENPLTADAVWNILPLDGKASLWGDEIYFSVPLTIDAENEKTIVKDGDLAYWPPGKALYIFFGPTPASWDKEIKPASPVNVFGRVENNAKRLKLVRPNEKIRIERS